MNEKKNLTWREAEDVMFSGGEVECLPPGCRTWIRYRILEGRLQLVSVLSGQWRADEDSPYDQLRMYKWRVDHEQIEGA